MATCPKCRAKYPEDVETCPEDGESLLPDEAIAAADRDLEPGEMVGEYQVKGKIARGGFGTVYRAIQPIIDKDVAIKVLRREFSANPLVVSRFISEAKAANKIHHRNIINIFSFGQLDDGRHYYVMDLYDGMPLDRILKARGSLTCAEAIPVLRDVGEALGAAHAQGIAHRDLKPANVFVTDEGEVRLLDFGVAKLLSSPNEHHTKSGAPLGTVRYMSPEQSRGRNVDQRTDIYSFGVMAYELLTGKPPFDGAQVDIVMGHLNETPTPPSEVCPDLPPELDAPILRMMEKAPADRPASVRAAAAALVSAAEEAGHPVPAAPLAALASGTNVSAAIAPTQPASSDPIGARAAESAPPEDVTTLRTARGRNRVAMFVGIAVVVIAAAVGIWRWRTGASRPTANAKPADSAPVAVVTPDAGVARAAAAPDAALPSPDAAPATVTIEIRGTPPDTVVRGPDGAVLGHAPGHLELEKSSEPIRLTLERRGYKTLVEQVVPDANIRISPHMVKKPSGGKPHGKDTPPDPDDLEKPF